MEERKKKKKKTNSTELQKYSIEGKVYNNNENVTEYTHIYTPTSKIKTAQQK